MLKKDNTRILPLILIIIFDLLCIAVYTVVLYESDVINLTVKITYSGLSLQKIGFKSCFISFFLYDFISPGFFSLSFFFQKR